MGKKKSIKILFIGNSHTYMHDLPHMVSIMAQEEGIQCHVTMIAHGGWYLHQHVEEPDVRFNIAYGNYDYVVLQEHSHPFDCIDEYVSAAKELNRWIKAAGARTVIYATWAMKDQPGEQSRMDHVNRTLVEELNAIYAPVGENWWAYSKAWPHIEMYESDGAHASADGTEFAARIIWASIASDLFIERLGI